MLKNKNEIKLWLEKMNIKNYTINDDFSVDVNENVNISKNKLTVIPIQFNHLKGGFNFEHKGNEKLGIKKNQPPNEIKATLLYQSLEKKLLQKKENKKIKKI